MKEVGANARAGRMRLVEGSDDSVRAERVAHVAPLVVPAVPLSVGKADREVLP